MDFLLRVVCWTSVILFVGLMLFGIVGNYLLARGGLEEKVASRLRVFLAYISDDTARLGPLRTANAGPSLTRAERELLLREVSVLAVAAAGKVSGRTMSREDLHSLSRAVLSEYQAGAEEGATQS